MNTRKWLTVIWKRLKDAYDEAALNPEAYLKSLEKNSTILSKPPKPLKTPTNIIIRPLINDVLLKMGMINACQLRFYCFINIKSAQWQIVSLEEVTLGEVKNYEACLEKRTLEELKSKVSQYKSILSFTMNLSDARQVHWNVVSYIKISDTGNIEKRLTVKVWTE